MDAFSSGGELPPPEGMWRGKFWSVKEHVSADMVVRIVEDARPSAVAVARYISTRQWRSVPAGSCLWYFCKVWRLSRYVRREAEDPAHMRASCAVGVVHCELEISFRIWSVAGCMRKTVGCGGGELRGLCAIGCGRLLTCLILVLSNDSE